jgi:hypothetical protein
MFLLYCYLFYLQHVETDNYESDHNTYCINTILHSCLRRLRILKICKPFKEPKNRFTACPAGTTTLFIVTARQDTWAGGIDSSESIPGLLKRFKNMGSVRQLYSYLVPCPMDCLKNSSTVFNAQIEWIGRAIPCLIADRWSPVAAITFSSKFHTSIGKTSL